MVPFAANRLGVDVSKYSAYQAENNSNGCETKNDDYHRRAEPADD